MRSLTSHIPPPSVGLVGYSFPGKPEDLLEGENWQSPDFHGAGVKGEQIFAHDLGVMKYNPKASNYRQWRFTTKYDGTPTDGSLNEHFRVWKKPVYAMADGEVIQVRDNEEDNTPQKTNNPDKENHVWIQHGDDNHPEAVAYAHFKQGSIDTSKIFGRIVSSSGVILKRGARVKRGDLLGLVGNSGRLEGNLIYTFMQLKETGIMMDILGRFYLLMLLYYHIMNY